MNFHILIQVVIFLIVSADAKSVSMAKANCTYMCGDVSIPYPFGIGKGCYLDEWFEITCNSSFNPKKPFLSLFNMEVLKVNFINSTVTVMNPVASNCQGQKGNTIWSSSNFTGSPYSFSGWSGTELLYRRKSRNEFVVVGCTDPALLYNYDDKIAIGCLSSCKPNASNEGCYGIHCCKSSLPFRKSLLDYTISIVKNTTKDCTYAFLGSVDSIQSFMNTTKQAPVEVSWRVKNLDKNCKYDYYDGAYYFYCQCSRAHTGNPYIPDGCKLVKACATCKKEYCGEDENTGDFYCYSWKGHRDYLNDIMYIVLDLRWSTRGVILLAILILHLVKGALLLLFGRFCFGLYKLINKKKIANLKKKFFKRNGGLLLEQQISSDEGTVQKAILFTSHELLKATDNYNENRILGQGGQGTVYKGMLADGKITAVKKSKLIDESQLDQFINEVVILSQMNHRNIVKLLGCCLETEVPLLVYEFVPNGNLFDLIHNENEEFPLTWKMRLQIATEVAGGLAYLHSASSVPIYHRDIKSTNILLDEQFKAKISDFGTSRSIAIEQTHLTTLVYGTLGYLDPEYYQSSQFTDKSDVYSFGVVLAELLTGQKPISSLIESQEERSLAVRFTMCAEQMRVFDILDARILEEAPKEEIVAVADIARRCLNVNGKMRPTMKEVMMDLEVLSRGPSNLAPTSFGRDAFNIEMDEICLDHDEYSTSTTIESDYRAFSSSNVDPLVYNTG